MNGHGRAHIVACNQTATRRAALAARPHAGVGIDHRVIHRDQCQSTRNLQIRRVDDELAAGSQHVAGQHHARSELVALGGHLAADEGIERRPGQHVNIHVAGDVEGAAVKIDAGQQWPWGTQGIGAEQGVERLAEDVLRFPTHGVEGEHRADRGAACGHPAFEVRGERRSILGAHEQITRVSRRQ